MKTCSKDLEIELSDGTTVEGTLHVQGFVDENFGADADGNRGHSMWLIDSWHAETNEELSEEQKTEFDREVEEIVFAESWDWEGASDPDDEPSDDE